MGRRGVWTQEGRVRPHVHGLPLPAHMPPVAPTGRQSRGPRRRVSSRARRAGVKRSQLQRSLLGPRQPGSLGSMHVVETASRTERRPRVLREAQTRKSPRRPLPAPAPCRPTRAARGSSRQLVPGPLPHCSVNWRRASAGPTRGCLDAPVGPVCAALTLF